MNFGDMIWFLWFNVFRFMIIIFPVEDLEPCLSGNDFDLQTFVFPCSVILSIIFFSVLHVLTIVFGYDIRLTFYSWYFSCWVLPISKAHYLCLVLSTYKCLLCFASVTMYWFSWVFSTPCTSPLTLWSSLLVKSVKHSKPLTLTAPLSRKRFSSMQCKVSKTIVVHTTQHISFNN